MSAALSLPPPMRPHAPRKGVLRFTLFAERILRLKLTRGQRIAALVAFDGYDPIDLPEADRPMALEMFGGVERIPPLVRSILVTVLRFGRWSGKSLLAAAHGVYRLVTADLSMCGPGDVPAVLVVSPRRVTSQIVLRAAMALVDGSPELRPLVTSRGAHSFKLRRPDRREVTFATVAKSAGGSAARGFSLIEFIFDESEFLPAADPAAAITDTAILASVLPRLLRGGHVLLISTPWPAESTTAALFDENFGHPVSALAARASTLAMRDHDASIARKIAIERERDPNNATREYDCLDADADGVFFELSTVDRALALRAPLARKLQASAGADLAFRSDSSALVIVERQGGRLVVVHVELVTPKPGVPLKPRVVCAQFSATAREHGCGELVVDGHYIESARDYATDAGLVVVEGPSLHGEKLDSFLYFRDLLREDLVDLGDPSLGKQLKSVLVVPQPGGGVRVVLPRRSGAGHADLVSAVINAAWHDRRHGFLLRPANTEVPQTIPSPYATGDGWMVR